VAGSRSAAFRSSPGGSATGFAITFTWAFVDMPLTHSCHCGVNTITPAARSYSERIKALVIPEPPL
jgi:hypothetical protein